MKPIYVKLECGAISSLTQFNHINDEVYCYFCHQMEKFKLTDLTQEAIYGQDDTSGCGRDIPANKEKGDGCQ